MIDPVRFSVTSPRAVLPGAPFLIDVWAHLERQREAVIQRAREAIGSEEIHIRSQGPVQVVRGTILSVRLKLEEFIVEDPESVILWDGDIGNATFSARVPQGAQEGPRPGMAIIRIAGLQIARIYFDIYVGRDIFQTEHIPIREERHRTAFASYASADRDEVLPRIQGIQKGAPHLSVFLDVLSLRSGQDWEQELWKIIPTKDVFGSSPN